MSSRLAPASRQHPTAVAAAVPKGECRTLPAAATLAGVISNRDAPDVGGRLG
jgi:hypothetical protein